MEKKTSPLTGVLEEKKVLIDFHPYRGQSISEVFEMDPKFYELLLKSKEEGMFSIRRHKDKTFRLELLPGKILPPHTLPY